MSLLSASVLGYPVPYLINWGKSFDHPAWTSNGSHIGKITGVSEWLQASLLRQATQLVLVSDGYDTIFQLRPDIMFSRYSSITRSLFARTSATLGQIAIVKEGIAQNVLFSAEKSCGPMISQWDKPDCYAQPESPLREDLYGDATDTIDDMHVPVHMRPTFLNSGMILGTTDEMKRMFAQAEAKIHSTEMEEDEEHHGSDQSIFNAVYGEQEFQREVIRQRHRSFVAMTWDAVRHGLGTLEPSVIDPNPRHVPMEKHPGHPLDFAIGLDYGMELVNSMVMSEFDGRYLMFNDGAQVLEAQTGQNAPPTPRVITLPDDIRASKQSPFQDLEMRPDSPTNTTWADVPLWTNIWTVSIPVMLHMNGIKIQRQRAWEHTWFYKRTREMLTARAFLSGLGAYDEVVVAREAIGLQTEDNTGKMYTWRNLCHDYEEELFGEKPFQ